MKLLEPEYTPDEVVLQMYRGERIPNAQEQWTLANSVYRQAIKDRNHLHKRDWEYESDDDLGEDLGGSGGREDLDEEAAGELGDEAQAGGDASKKESE